MAMIATSRLNRLPAAERGITIGDFLVPIRVGERLSSRIRHVVADRRSAPCSSP